MKINILHAFSLYGNPSEIWGFRQMDQLVQLGAGAGVITCRYWTGNFPERPWTVYHMPVLSGGEGLLRRALSYALTPRLLRPAGYDLVHAHFGPAGWRFLPLARRLGVPLVVSFYGNDYRALPNRRPVWRTRYRALFRDATAVFVEGPHGAGLLASMGCPPEKIRIVRLGIDLPNPLPAPRGKAPQTLRLVQVASFVEKKGHSDALMAFARALPACPGMTLTLAGDGDRRPLEQLARALGIAGQVTFRDFVPYGALRSFLSDFDVFIHPSRHAADGDSEGGAPTILMEAQVCGLPVIATMHCDIPALIRDRVGGRLAPEGDVAALSESIRYFYGMDTLAFQTYSGNAVRCMAEERSAPDCARHQLEIYQQVLAAH